MIEIWQGRTAILDVAPEVLVDEAPNLELHRRMLVVDDPHTRKEDEI